MGSSFSPLYVGSVVVTQHGSEGVPVFSDFQSPIRRVSGCNAYFNTASYNHAVGFQSPIRRVSGCNVEEGIDPTDTTMLSVPYTSGQWL